MFKNEANTQKPSSDFKGTSLAVLKGAKQLLTYKFLFVTVFLDVKFNKSKRPMDMSFYLIYFLQESYLLKFLT